MLLPMFLGSAAGFGAGKVLGDNYVQNATSMNLDTTANEANRVMSDIFSNAIASSAEQTANANALQEQWFNKTLDFNSAQSQINRDFQSAEAERARSYSTEMSNSALSRTIDSYKEEGLNPYLTLSNGLNVTSPTSSGVSGASASSATPQIKTVDSMLNSYVSMFNSLNNSAVSMNTTKYNTAANAIFKSMDKIAEIGGKFLNFGLGAMLGG